MVFWSCVYRIQNIWQIQIWMRRTHFYQLSKPCHLLVAKEGEESQEDSSKMKSVEKNTKSQMWVLRCFVHDHRFSWKYELRWCQNWQTCHAGWTTNFMCRSEISTKKLKFGTWIHKLKFSCRIMKKHVLIKDEIYFMIFGWKCVNAIRSGWVGLMELDERKVFEVWRKNALSWENKWKWMRSLSFHTLKIFLTRKTWMEWKNLKNWS